MLLAFIYTAVFAFNFLLLNLNAFFIANEKEVTQNNQLLYNIYTMACLIFKGRYF